jgi:hypothetical protein
MTPQDYGLATGQHSQPRQQARLFTMPTPPTRIEAFFGCAHPAGEDWLRDTIDATFRHADRIEIESWTFPTETLEPTAEDRAEYYRELAGDQSYEENRP